MEERFRKYIDSLFEGVEDSLKLTELKEEILQNTIEKYQDLRSSGKSEEAAFNIATAGIGDIRSLINDINEPRETKNINNSEKSLNEKQKSALFTSGAVMLYILSVVPLFIFQNELGLILLLVFVAAATGMIIYNSITRSKYHKNDESMVENFKEWSDSNNGRNELLKSINSAIFAIVLVVYFIISFATGAWYITWIIFLIGGAIKNIVKAVMDYKR